MDGEKERGGEREREREREGGVDSERQRDRERRNAASCYSTGRLLSEPGLGSSVININSTKWVVIKLSRVVNDPQRQNWSITGHTV